VTASPSTPAGYVSNFTINLSGNLGITGSGNFSTIVGQIPVLIIDLDVTKNSGPVMQAKIQALGIGVDYVTVFPASVNLYASVFLCLGIYPNNTVLSASQGTLLASYLNGGGKLYMEGGDTWAYDAATAVHSMFGISGVADGSGDMGTIAGQTGTFTQGLTFTYSGENNWMDHIDPTGTAFSILKNQSPLYGTGVAYNQGTYKTIGTSHEFGGLNDGTYPSTKQELMYRYLDFFGLIPPPLPPTVDLKIFLEGPFAGSTMSNSLNSGGDLPLSQPFSGSPWNYGGTESVGSIPNSNVIDWVLIEFRDAPGAAATATGSTIVERQAAFLLSDGSVVGMDGSSLLQPNVTINNNLFVVVNHRNHIPVMSATAIVLSGSTYEYDFSTAISKVYNGSLCYKQIGTGIYGMVSGDGLCDGLINNDDKEIVWWQEAGLKGYYNGDFNRDGSADNVDKNDYWLINTENYGSQVPE
jgi:hypothetical protein